MATRPKRPRAPVRRPLPAPGQWWREPLTRQQRESTDDPDQLASLRALERHKRVERLKEQIRELREFSNGYGAGDGYPLSTRKLVRIPASKIAKVRRESEVLRTARARYYVPVSPRTEKQRKSVEKISGGKLLKNQKKYLVHITSSKTAKAKFIDGNLQIVDAVKGGDLMRRIYMFPRRSKTWEPIVGMIEDIFESSPEGYYQMFNSVYGPIGRIISKSLFIANIDTQFSGYDPKMHGTLIGVIWVANTLTGALRAQSLNERLKYLIHEKRLARYKQERELAASRLKGVRHEYVGDPKQSPEHERHRLGRNRKARAARRHK